ncbi:MAG: glycosyltransferase [Lachnospiraceae bacterium]|jgi:glycosyltransferase involved in cell wall biosynthesis|nr:glycosyltransferase [Lachnospiraceae bacterium]
MINIILPVYNEEKRVRNGIIQTIKFMDKFYKGKYSITVINNGSTDGTKDIVDLIKKEKNQVKSINLEKKGVGLAFREGIKCNTEDIVGYMDIDLSTDIRHLKRVVELFEKDSQIQMVNGSRLNRRSKITGRKWYRMCTSRGLTALLKIVFKMKATDAICGFKFYRKEFIEHLVSITSSMDDGWFYIIELLLLAEKEGAYIYELPVHWKDDSEHTHVNVFKQSIKYIRGIAELYCRLRRSND